MKRQRIFQLALTVILFCVPTSLLAVQINEIRFDQPGRDTDEYFELKGAPGESLDGLTYLVIGDLDSLGMGSGVIEEVTPLTGMRLNASGFFVVAEASCSFKPDFVTVLRFENLDNVTHLLVRNFTSGNNQDLDLNDDCTLDVTPWESIVDKIAIVMEPNPPTMTECNYGPPSAGPDSSSPPGHLIRLESTWLTGSFTFGIDDTPGAENLSGLVPVMARNWTHVKLYYR